MNNEKVFCAFRMVVAADADLGLFELRVVWLLLGAGRGSPATVTAGRASGRLQKGESWRSSE
jgi:hypothetical protein